MKKNFIHWLFLLAVVKLFASCDNDTALTQSPQTENPNLIGIEEALDNADAMFSQVYGSTRAIRRPSSIVRFGSSKTRTSDDEGLEGYYVVNYDGGGFSVLSADKRQNGSVYAISNVSSLNLTDTIENKGLGMYLNEILPSIASKASIKPIDPEYPGEPIDPIDPGWTYYNKHSDPLLAGFHSKFRQGEPYNYYCNLRAPENVRYIVGCVPLAVGTVMGYYSWPSSLEGYSLDWNAMHNSSQNLLWARLFEILGRKRYVDAQYSHNVTSAYSKNIPRAFVNAGYTGAKYESFDTSVVNASLGNKNPVLCDGIEDGANSGHEWIIDGGFTKGYIEMPITPDDQKKKVYDSYYHCVWGWGGMANGYYLYSHSRGLGEILSELDPGNYPYQAPSYNKLRIVHGYKPNK